MLLAGLALSVPAGATMLASKFRTGSALTGFRAIGVALGVRPSRRHVGRKAALLGGGMLAAGLLVMLGLGMRPVLVRTQE